MQNHIKSRPRWIRLETTSKPWRQPDFSHLSYPDTFRPQCWEQMSYYMFLHFKSDIAPHLTPPLPHSDPSICLLCNPLLTFIYSHLPSAPSMSLSCSTVYSMVFSHFLSRSPAISMMYFILTMLCFHFLSLPFLPSSPPLCPNTPPLCQSLCVREHCCGCRRPALCRRRSTRQGRGVRIHCSLGTDCTSCPGPPIARTCCMSMPPGKTSNRAKPPPTTSEGASHCPGWSNSICCCIDLLAFDVDMDGDATEVSACSQWGHLVGLCHAE